MFLLNSRRGGLSCWSATLEISDFVQSLFVLPTQIIVFIWVENNVGKFGTSSGFRLNMMLLKTIIQYPNISILISILSKVCYESGVMANLAEGWFCGVGPSSILIGEAVTNIRYHDDHHHMMMMVVPTLMMMMMIGVSIAVCVCNTQSNFPLSYRSHIE